MATQQQSNSHILNNRPLAPFLVPANPDAHLEKHTPHRKVADSILCTLIPTRWKHDLIKDDCATLRDLAAFAQIVSASEMASRWRIDETTVQQLLSHYGIAPCQLSDLPIARQILRTLYRYQIECVDTFLFHPDFRRMQRFHPDITREIETHWGTWENFTHALDLHRDDPPQQLDPWDIRYAEAAAFRRRCPTANLTGEDGAPWWIAAWLTDSHDTRRETPLTHSQWERLDAVEKRPATTTPLRRRLFRTQRALFQAFQPTHSIDVVARTHQVPVATVERDLLLHGFTPETFADALRDYERRWALTTWQQEPRTKDMFWAHKRLDHLKSGNHEERLLYRTICRHWSETGWLLYVSQPSIEEGHRKRPRRR